MSANIIEGENAYYKTNVLIRQLIKIRSLILIMRKFKIKFDDRL